MPCFVTGSEAGDRELDLREAQELSTKLTDLLCRTCRALENLGSTTFMLDPELRAWWAGHKKVDSRRKKKKK